jgi:hypothetical protein
VRRVHNAGFLMVLPLKECGDNLTRENIIQQPHLDI